MKMTDDVVENTTITPEQMQLIEEEYDDQEWVSDWGAVFICCLLLIVVLGGLSIASWQPWLGY